MLFNFNALIEKYELTIKGIIHIGAHTGQEYSLYKNLNINNLVFIEPLPHIFDILKERVGNNALLFNTALGNSVGSIDMYVETANSGQSSSILQPNIHLKQYPHIAFTSKITVPITKLDYLINEKIYYNFLNIDVQGYELEVLKGGVEFLNYIDYIITEVNRDELYKNCAMVGDLDTFLNYFNFQRVETEWAGGTWGDALYVKKLI